MELLVIIAAGIGASCAAIFGGLLLRTARIPADDPPSPGTRPRGNRVEMFVTDGRLVDATPQARQLLDCTPDERLIWDDLAEVLRAHFPAFPEAPPRDRLVLDATGDPDTHIEIRPEGRSLNLSMTGPSLDAGEYLRLRTEMRDLSRLRLAFTRAPFPVWQTDRARKVVWSNPAFTDVALQAGQADNATPPFAVLPNEAEELYISRTSIGKREDGTQSWFEVQSYRLADGWLHFAQNIDAVIHAEATQRNFLQTLTRIFAHLPIALAVFDKDRRLVLFNPALIDHTNLPAEFLSSRPNLLSFFDMLRERQMMPEPKDYRSWRDKLSEVIAAASSDLYTEVWNLPVGLTYRITGRPHPDGGVAFLFEDITSEISLTRRFRQEIEVTQSVLDSLGDAVAVFSQLGTLTFTNAAYRDMWNLDLDGSLADTCIAESTRLWQSACKFSPIWSDLRDFVMTERDRAGWDAELIRSDGQRLLSRVEPLAGGSTLVRFSALPADAGNLRRRRENVDA
ncbi:PAS-domain containing protein [Citreicella sp. C3M06]|uniref:PAS-domain containing protein n=1 Tax=Citreicella sp. C3M06 TaxID=2841564 RepID=UPI001C08F4BE|nr:PAS-domain containing protein [Citreicella sp. C3M06]